MKRDRNTPSQRHRVARALRLAGSRGLTQVDFDAPALDGHPPIRRLASRINDLRATGWVIDSSGRRLGMARYVLVREPARQADPAAVPDDRALFDDGIGQAPPACAIKGEVE